MDHFTKHVEAFQILGQSEETFAMEYAAQIVTRLGTGSTPIADQGRSLMSSFL